MANVAGSCNRTLTGRVAINETVHELQVQQICVVVHCSMNLRVPVVYQVSDVEESTSGGVLLTSETQERPTFGKVHEPRFSRNGICCIPVQFGFLGFLERPAPG